jgi:hypothetical protein
MVSLQQDGKGPEKVSGESVARKRPDLNRIDRKIGVAFPSHKDKQL